MIELAESRVNLLSIVFRLGPVQSSGFRFWSGHRVVWVNLKNKLKGRRFSKKNKSQWIITGFLTESTCRVTLGFSFPCYSSTRPNSSPGSTSRVTPGFIFSYFFLNYLGSSLKLIESQTRSGFKTTLLSLSILIRMG